jgi:hypothetical protein
MEMFARKILYCFYQILKLLYSRTIHRSSQFIYVVFRKWSGSSKLLSSDTETQKHLSKKGNQFLEHQLKI